MMTMSPKVRMRQQLSGLGKSPTMVANLIGSNGREQQLQPHSIQMVHTPDVATLEQAQVHTL
jgi:hypothetical protein